jgi:hypothetical protein
MSRGNASVLDSLGETFFLSLPNRTFTLDSAIDRIEHELESVRGVEFEWWAVALVVALSVITVGLACQLVLAVFVFPGMVARGRRIPHDPAEEREGQQPPGTPPSPAKEQPPPDGSRKKRRVPDHDEVEL